jgi:DNA-binding SARP family transcriptional activator
MGVAIQLLGPPSIARSGKAVAPPRGRKAWALLAYLLLSERRATRATLASLLFGQADDPRRALRWTLVELRRALGIPEALRGDPLELRLPADAEVDVLELHVDRASGQLLEGIDLDAAPVFDAWLQLERRRLAGVCEELLRDAARDRLAAGDAQGAVAVARRAVALNRLDEDNHELLVRCLAASGDTDGAVRYAAACEELFERELGQAPSAAVRSAAGARRGPAAPGAGNRVAARGQLEAGALAIASGVVDPGIECLRVAAAEAAVAGDLALRARCLCALGTALVQSVRGGAGEGVAVLRTALALAQEAGDRETTVRTFLQLGYVEVRAGRMAPASLWLSRATALARSDAELAPVLGVRAMALSDRAHYEAALTLAGRSAERAERCGDVRQVAWSLAIAGRVHLLRGDLDDAAGALDRALDLADGWIAFRSWPESLRAEVELLDGRAGAAAARLEEAYGLACRIGDPCWEAIGARATGLLHRHRGDVDGAARWIEEAIRRSNVVSDHATWVYCQAVDAAADLAIATGDRPAAGLVAGLADTAARAGLRELVVRARLHAHRLGERGALEAARRLAAEIDNPALESAVRGAR